MKYKRIVLNEPHASLEGLYTKQLSFWRIDESFINDIVFKWTDWHTDFLFHGYENGMLKTVRFPYSRFIVDAERLWKDPLEKIGQGIIYKHFNGYFRSVPKEREVFLLNLWLWHQSQLRSNLSPDALLLDCHSFPSEMSEADICIGYNEDWSKPQKETLEFAINLFEENHYKVAVNEPFSNSETPECPFCYESMMLEINKKAYMDENTLQLKSDSKYKKIIRDVIRIFLKEIAAV